MALGKSKSFGHVDVGFEMGVVTYTPAPGRKRIAISENGGDSFDSTLKTPLKKRCGVTKKKTMTSTASASSSSSSPSTALETLPQDLLVKVLCGVDHEDLDKLSHVSKSIGEATSIAKEWHFAYSTPKKVRPFRSAMDVDRHDNDEIEAPNAPKQTRPRKSRLFGEKLDSIAVNLFE